VKPSRADIPVPYEEDEQKAVMKWAEVQGLNVPALRLLHHIPNGSSKLPIGLAKKLKSLGLKAGVPDLCLPVAAQGFHALYVEMKRVKGSTTSEEQKSWHAALRERGNRVEVCKGAGEAIAVIRDYLGMHGQREQPAPASPALDHWRAVAGAEG
jgi:hypothetical protein